MRQFEFSVQMVNLKLKPYFLPCRLPIHDLLAELLEVARSERCDKFLIWPG